ncbi:MAG: CdaR family transcriptional regulator [Bacillota bacterium]
MRITRQLADIIVRKTKELTLMNMNVMDRNGIIISSSDPQRIGTLHKGAIEVIRTEDEMIISTEDTMRWAGTKPGINMPIFFQNELVGVIGITGQEAEVIPFGRAVRMMTEMLLQQAYLTEQIEMKERAKAYLVQEMISPSEQTSKDVLLARGQLLGVDLTLPRSMMIIHVEMNDKMTSGDLDQSYYRFTEITRLFHNPKQTLLAQLGLDTWVVIPEISCYKNEKHAKEELLHISSKIAAFISSRFKTDAQIAIGKGCKNADELAKSFQETLSLLKIIYRYPEKGQVMHIDDAALELILGEISETSGERIIHETLGDLHQYPDLLNTLQSFYDSDMNLNETARKMGIHRNTLMYRLDRIESLIHANPKQFHQAVRIQLALMLYKYKM